MAISSITSTGTPTVPGTGAVAPASTQAVSAGSLGNTTSSALYLNLDISPSGAGATGLRLPQSPEDAAILLAEAELALNQTANNASNAGIEAQFGSARGALNINLQAVLTAAQNLPQAKTDLATASGNLSTAISNQSDTLKAYSISTTAPTNADLAKAITDLDSKITSATASGDTATAQTLTGERDGLQTISDLNTQVATLSIAIALAEQAPQQLALTFGQVALTLQTGNGAFDRDHDKSIRLDLGFDDLRATADRFRTNDLSRTIKSVDGQDEVKQAKSKAEDVARLAGGLAAGIADALAVLRQSIDAPPPKVPKDAALAGAGDRLRFAL